MNVLFNKVFRSLGLFFYLIIFRIVQVFLSSPKIKIWYRHGLYFKTIIPGISDIDTSLLIAHNTPIKEQSKAIGKFALVKQFIPIFSEVNIYEKNELNFIKHCMNPLELKRDPLLCRYADFPINPPTKEEKLVYTIKMLLYNKKNFLSYPSLMKKKWITHLTLLEINEIIKYPLLPSLLKILEKNLFNLFPRLYLKNALEEYFNKDIIPDKLHAFLIHPFEFLFHEIRYDLTYNPSFCRETFHILNQSEQGIYASHLKWDIWGIYTQYRLLVPATILPHLKHMEVSVDLIGKEWHYLKEKIRNLSHLVTVWQNNVNTLS